MRGCVSGCVSTKWEGECEMRGCVSGCVSARWEGVSVR